MTQRVLRVGDIIKTSTGNIGRITHFADNGCPWFVILVPPPNSTVFNRGETYTTFLPVQIVSDFKQQLKELL